MKTGDLVMFKPEGTYAEWFGGKFATVTHMSFGVDGKNHCRVKWLEPIKYFDKHTTVSDFSCDRFVVC